MSRHWRKAAVHAVRTGYIGESQLKALQIDLTFATEYPVSNAAEISEWDELFLKTAQRPEVYVDAASEAVTWFILNANYLGLPIGCVPRVSCKCVTSGTKAEKPRLLRTLVNGKRQVIMRPSSIPHRKSNLLKREFLHAVSGAVDQLKKNEGALTYVSWIFTADTRGGMRLIRAEFPREYISAMIHNDKEGQAHPSGLSGRANIIIYPLLDIHPREIAQMMATIFKILKATPHIPERGTPHGGVRHVSPRGNLKEAEGGATDDVAGSTMEKTQEATMDDAAGVATEGAAEDVGMDASAESMHEQQ